EGRQTPGMPMMPAIKLAPGDVNAVAAYVRSILATASRQGAPRPGPPPVLKVLVGDAAAGQRYFAAKCSACHVPTGDLKGVGAKYPDATTLQNTWVAGGGGGGGGGGGAARSPPPRRHARSRARGAQRDGDGDDARRPARRGPSRAHGRLHRRHRDGRRHAAQL